MGKKKIKEKSQVIFTDKQVQKIIDNAMKTGWLLWIKTSAFGNRKKLSKSLLMEKFQEDAQAISAAQRLINHEEVRNVVQPMNKVITMIRNKSLPWIHDGVYFILEKDIIGIQEELTKTLAEMKERRNELIEKYPTLKAEAKKNFPKLFKEEHYPTTEMLKEKFNFLWGWQRISLPMEESNNSVISVSKDLAVSENLKFQELMKGLAEETINTLRTSFKQLILNMRDKLKDPSLKFKKSTIEKPKQFLEDFKTLNIYGDKPFEELIGDIRDILDGVYAEDLRDDEKYRKEIGEAVEDIIDVFNELPTVKLKRSLDF